MIEILLGPCITFSTPHIEEDYSRVRYINIVTKDPYEIKDYKGHTISVPYIDPPYRGFDYEAADTSPYYWDDKSFKGNKRHKVNHPNNRNTESLIFKDCPQDYRLKTGESIEFITCSYDTLLKEIIDCQDWKLLHNQKVELKESSNKDLVIPLVIKWIQDNNVCNLCSK